MEIVHSKIFNTGSKTSILKHPSKKQGRNQHKWQYKRHGKKGRKSLRRIQMRRNMIVEDILIRQ